MTKSFKVNSIGGLGQNKIAKSNSVGNVNSIFKAYSAGSTVNQISNKPIEIPETKEISEESSREDFSKTISRSHTLSSHKSMETQEEEKKKDVKEKVAKHLQNYSEMSDPEIDFQKEWREEIASSSDELSVEENFSSNCSVDHSLQRANEIDLEKFGDPDCILSEYKIF